MMHTLTVLVQLDQRLIRVLELQVDLLVWLLNTVVDTLVIIRFGCP